MRVRLPKSAKNSSDTQSLILVLVVPWPQVPSGGPTAEPRPAAHDLFSSADLPAASNGTADQTADGTAIGPGRESGPQPMLHQLPQDSPAQALGRTFLAVQGPCLMEPGLPMPSLILPSPKKQRFQPMDFMGALEALRVRTTGESENASRAWMALAMSCLCERFSVKPLGGKKENE